MAISTAIVLCIFGVVFYRKKTMFPRGNKRKEADSMITEDEKAILKLAGILWIYDNDDKSIKNNRKRKTKRKKKGVKPWL
jgi:hypothetical protein